ncbi:ABC transporter substrate-binding protein [Clostridium sp. MT-14]|uniref:ABC transporter substrate-binding protein n=1 Tax=Clostridium sp. MT-14 TaxID=3348360 RepID=UPI0035F23D58
MKDMKKRFKFLILFKIVSIFVVIIFGLTACGTSDAGNSTSEKKSSSGKVEKVTTIKIAGYWGAGGVTIYDPLTVAQKLGYFKHIKIESTGIPTGADLLAALTSGRIQAGMLQYSMAASATAKGAKLKAVASAHGGKSTFNLRFYVPKDSPIKGPKDLKGKSIGGIKVGSTWYYALTDWLTKAGLSINDVKLVNVEKGTTLQVLERNQLAGAGTFYEFEQNPIEATGKYRVLFSAYDLLPKGLEHCGLFVTQKFIDDNPEAVKELVAGFEKANTWLQKNPEKGKELHIQIAKDRKLNPTLIEKYYPVTDIRAHSLVKKSDAQYFIDKLEKYKNIPKGKVKATDLYTNKFNPYASQGDK